MLFELRGLAQNLVMGFAPLRKELHKRFSNTGMNGDVGAARDRFGRYAQQVTVKDQSILELGPGHTIEVLLEARKLGAQRCVALDIEVILDAAMLAARGIELASYDGMTIPYSTNSFDVIWSSDVLEHVRRPEALMRDCFRVLRPGGTFLAHIDLRDHYYLPNEDRWVNCLRYPEWLWWAMTSNRGSFVNRLRASEWRTLVERVGFDIHSFEEHESEVLRRLYRSGSFPIVRGRLDEHDATTFELEVVLRKPAAVAR
jgi:SAM-dependent methyltransferase